MSEWTLFSNHGHVLVCLAKNNEARLRDVSAEVGITERAVQNILRELQDAGLVSVSKHGRCNHYQINSRKHLRHALESHCTVGKLLQLLIQGDAGHDPVAAAAKPAEKLLKPTPPKMSPVEQQIHRPVSTSPPAVKVTSVEPVAPDRIELAAAKSEPDPVKTEKTTTEKTTTEQLTTDRAPPAAEAGIEAVSSSAPEAEEKASSVTPVAAKLVSKPEPAKSKKAASKKDDPEKDDPKKDDKTPSSQQGSLF